MTPPEVHAPHPHHGGGLPKWLELTIAVSALVTSLSSIAIAIHHGQIMEKLVQANSIPYLQGGFSDRTPSGEKVMSLDLLNRGVAPAHERSLFLKVGGRYVRSTDEFMTAVFGRGDAKMAEQTLDPVWNRVATRFIPGGQNQTIFRVPRSEANAAYWDRMYKDEGRWSVEICYCSVFDDCWRVHDKWQEPVKVKECRRDPAREFVP